MKLEYCFTVPVGKEFYSEDRDEVFQDEESIDWEFYIEDEQQCEALVDFYSNKNKPIEEQAKEIMRALLTPSQIKDIMDCANKKTLDGTISQAMLDLMQGGRELNICNLLIQLLGELGYFVEDLVDDFTDYFETAAKRDFESNNN